jgi:E3 ubiquitin-protein ligase RFWD3
MMTPMCSGGYRYGFVKYSLLDPMQLEAVRLHNRDIRDIKPSPRTDGLVLTASLDKTIKLTSLTSNTIVQR